MLKVKTDEELKECFKFELSPIPLSLFDKAGHMRKTQKSILYNNFPTITYSYDVQEESIIHVIDGGFLLNSVVWGSNLKYRNIFEAYIIYIKKHYGSNCVVVFYGYTNSDNNIKSSERRRRQNST